MKPIASPDVLPHETDGHDDASHHHDADRDVMRPSVASFVFNEASLLKAQEVISHYPHGRESSAVIALLDIAQRQSGGWLPRQAIDYVADFLSMPRIRVYEVATFYSMFHLTPKGRYVVQVCGTTPCWLRGAHDIMQCCKKKLAIEPGETTQDGQFSLIEVECLGACANAPMVQINDDYYEDLTTERMESILQLLAEGKVPEAGSHRRRCSEPFMASDMDTHQSIEQKSEALHGTGSE